MIHQPLSPDGVHPPNQFVPEIVSPMPCSSGLVRYILVFVYFFKELISFIGFLDKCHTSVFNALISVVVAGKKTNYNTAPKVNKRYSDLATIFRILLLPATNSWTDRTITDRRFHNRFNTFK